MNIGYNTEDFESGVIFTKAEIPNGKASIGETKKEITFETEKLESVGDKAILKYEIANISRNYDAKVIINCGLKENYESFSEYIEVNQNLESPFELISGNRKSGELTIELKKAYEKSLEERIEYV